MWGSSISFGRIWERKGGPQLRFHRVGSKQIDDVVVFDDKKNSEHTFAAQVSEDDQLLFLHVFKGGRSHKLWAAKITPEHFMASFRPEFKFDIIISEIFEVEWRHVKFHRGKMLADEQIYEIPARFCCFLTGMFPLPNSLSHVPRAAFAQARLMPSSV
jgi:hypothetical protein